MERLRAQEKVTASTKPNPMPDWVTRSIFGERFERLSDRVLLAFPVDCSQDVPDFGALSVGDEFGT